MDGKNPWTLLIFGSYSSQIEKKPILRSYHRAVFKSLQKSNLKNEEGMWTGKCMQKASFMFCSSAADALSTVYTRCHHMILRYWS